MAVFRSTWILILCFVLCGWGEAAAQEHPQFAVVVYNDAGIPGQVVTEAKEIARTIYRDAGIELVWMDHPNSHLGITQFFVRIVPRSLNLPGDDFGIAFVGSDGRGIQADVFYSGIDRMAKSYSLNPAEITGHVMAHELGHLLLGMNSHSNLGIMQARWADQQLHQMSMGALKFDNRQAEIIGARLRSRETPRIEAELRGY